MKNHLYLLLLLVSTNLFSQLSNTSVNACGNSFSKHDIKLNYSIGKIVVISKTNSISTITSIEGETIMVYPNPCVDFIKISKIFKNVKIYNTQCQLVYSENQTNIINTSLLLPGVYFLQTEKFTYKFIKS